MRRVLAVALLDLRRLGFGLSAAALVSGLVPSLSSGLGGKVAPRDVLMIAFVIVGAAAGEFFGADFAEGKSSFYFARPLPTLSLIAGRFTALLTLAAMVFVGFMASFWISSSDRSGWSLSILTRNHFEGLGTGWSMALFLRLAVAAHGRARRSVQGFRELAKIPVRLAFCLAAFILVFGFFADLMMRAYVGPGPVWVLMGSWITAALVASLVAMASGRTEGLRIARVQILVVAGYAVLASAAVIATWGFVLHPGPDAIEEVMGVSGSPDGRYAWVQTSVGRGEPGRFQPLFVLDLASGQARRLNSDPVEGPWSSADGATMVWGEGTPIFFRPLWRLMGGSWNLRVKTGSGDAEELPAPRGIFESGPPRDISLRLTSVVDWVLPSRDGSVFALHQWFGPLVFMSRSGEQLSRAPLGKGRSIRAAAFTERGMLRLATLYQEGATPMVEFVEMDPRSGSTSRLASLPVQAATRVRMDARAERALVSTAFTAYPSSVTLVHLGGDRGGSSVLLGGGEFPSAMFLADGRIVATTSVPSSPARRLSTFSPTGQSVLNVPMEGRAVPSLGDEMFPGVVGVQFARTGVTELALFDVGSGTFIRRLHGFRKASIPSILFDLPSPPGTPAARLVLSGSAPGGKLYELPSLDGEPRLILPLPRS